jgi:hypothetical protein
MIDDGDCGEIGGMKIGRGNQSTRRKPAPVPNWKGCRHSVILDTIRTFLGLNEEKRENLSHDSRDQLHCSSYFLILKMEAVRSSGKSANFYQATRRHIPDERTIHIYWRY